MMNLFAFAVQNASPDERTFTGRLLWLMIKCYAIAILVGIVAIPVGFVMVTRYEVHEGARQSAYLTKCLDGATPYKDFDSYTRLYLLCLEAYRRDLRP